MNAVATDPKQERAALSGSGEESRWTSLHYFSIYRLAIASVFLAASWIYRGSLTFGSQNLRLFALTSAAYWVFALATFASRRSRKGGFDFRLSVQAIVDIVALTLMMYASGGHRSGLAFMMLIVLAGAGLVGQGRLVVFYAAVAAIAVLGEHGFRLVTGSVQGADMVPVAITAAGFFAVAVISRYVGQRAMTNEELARRRGVDLANQMHINERVIRDMQDGALVIDSDGRLRQWNPRAQLLLGVPLQTGALIRDVAPEVGRHVEDGQGIGEQAIPVRLPDGAREIAVRIVPASERGDLLVYIEDLGRLQDQARELKLAALGRLTANMAHEIRNPLSSITHAAELLREEKRAETQVRLTRIINDNAQRIERLIRDVLELGRRDRVQPESIRLLPFLEGFLEELSLHQGDLTSRVWVDCPEELVVRCDRVHLNQILGNLVGNALRYCTDEPGAVKLRVSLHGAPGGSGDRVELHIVDNGCGISEALQTQVFEPFVTTYSKGTGLGLFIARELAAANDAILDLLDNAPGAHFRLILKTANE